METKSVFPWRDLIPDAVLTLASSFVALSCTVVLASYLGPQYCVVIFNDHVIGGTQDQFTMVVVGTAFGATAIFLARQIRSRVVEWRREHDGEACPRVFPR